MDRVEPLVVFLSDYVLIVYETKMHSSNEVSHYSFHRADMTKSRISVVSIPLAAICSQSSSFPFSVRNKIIRLA